jgi:hypothetical protein
MERGLLVEKRVENRILEQTLFERLKIPRWEGGDMTEPDQQSQLSKEPRRKFALWAVLFAAVVVGTFSLHPWDSRTSLARYSFLSGDPVRGGSLFSGLGCNA